jgi:hypothetical protein
VTFFRNARQLPAARWLPADRGKSTPELTSILTSTGADVPARGRMEDAVRNPEINTQRTAADDPGQQFSGFLNQGPEFVFRRPALGRFVRRFFTTRTWLLESGLS